MLMRLKKVTDGVVLTCIRDDTSIEVQRTGHNGFFALHDLLHFSVETELDITRAFLGLVASGWSFSAFSDKTDPRYSQMPHEAIQIEHLVDILMRRGSDPAIDDPELRNLWADEINDDLAKSLERTNHPRMTVSVEELVRAVERFRELGIAWANVPMGEHLELTFAPQSTAM